MYLLLQTQQCTMVIIATDDVNTSLQVLHFPLLADEAIREHVKEINNLRITMQRVLLLQ